MRRASDGGLEDEGSTRRRRGSSAVYRAGLCPNLDNDYRKEDDHDRNASTERRQHGIDDDYRADPAARAARRGPAAPSGPPHGVGPGTLGLGARTVCLTWRQVYGAG